MPRVRVWAILFIYVLGISFAQTRIPVEITNNSVIPNDELMPILAPLQQKVKDYSTSEASGRIYSLLQDYGYFRASVIITPDLRDTSSNYVKLIIDAGKRARFGKVAISLTDTNTAQIAASRFQDLQGKEMSVLTVTDEINQSLILLENAGYPFARFVVNQVNYTDSSNSVDIDMMLDPGRKCKIDKIIVSGNNTTKDFVITRHLRFSPGQIYVQKQIDRVSERLAKLKLFQFVSEPSYFIDKSEKGILRIEVKEKNNNTFDGIIGYNPGTATGDKGYVTGMVNFQFRNLFGTGRAAAVRWQKLDRHSSELELQYTEPWILDYPFTFEGRYYQRQQDTTYVTRLFEGVIDFAATDEVSVGLQFGTQVVIPSLLSANVFTVFHSSAFSSGLRVKIDTRDDPLVPQKGIYFSNLYLFTQKKISGPQEFITPATKTKSEQQKIAADIAGYYPLFKAQVLTLALHGRELRGNMIEISDFYKMGGANTLRGYRENQFAGQRLAWLNLEYRFMLEQRSYAFLFFDNGYYLQSENAGLKIQKNEGARSGYGLGLTFQSGLGLMNVSYALGKGASFSQGLIHFGLINEF